MTEKELKQYRFLLKEIEMLEKRIQEEREKPVNIVSGKVTSSMKEHPYIEKHVSVQMYEPKKADTINHALKIYQTRLMDAEKKKIEIEQYIGKIRSTQVRLIFQYRYIDGMTISSIGETLGYTKGRISQLISKKLKD